MDSIGVSPNGVLVGPEQRQLEPHQRLAQADCISARGRWCGTRLPAIAECRWLSTPVHI